MDNHYDRLKASQKKLAAGKALQRKKDAEKAKKEYGEDHPVLRKENKTFFEMRSQIDELSTNTLGRYASKAHQSADIGISSGENKNSAKRVKGAQLAVKKLAKRADAKSDGTRTANNIAKNADLAKKWRSDKSVDRNKTYQSAEKGINSLWDKAAKKRGNN